MTKVKEIRNGFELQCDKISTKKELHGSRSRVTNDGNRLHRNGPEETLRVPEGSERVSLS